MSQFSSKQPRLMDGIIPRAVKLLVLMCVFHGLIQTKVFLSSLFKRQDYPLSVCKAFKIAGNQVSKHMLCNTQTCSGLVDQLMLVSKRLSVHCKINLRYL